VNKILMIVGPALAGAALAGITVVALVSAQNAAPSDNPAREDLITYGTR